MNPTKNIGAFTHPQFGEFYMWYDTATGRYTLTRPQKHPPHCVYVSLAEAFNLKGI